MTTTTAQQDLAEALSHALEGAARPDGTSYIRIRDGSPDWVTNVIREAHGDFLPDDERYNYISAAVEILVGSDNWEEADSEIESDIYTADLCLWLASHASRHMYCDEYVEEFGWPGATFKLLQGGQYMERREVFYSIRQSLEALAEEADGE